MGLDDMVLLVRSPICARETTPTSLPAAPDAIETIDGLSDQLGTLVLTPGDEVGYNINLSNPVVHT